MNGFLVVVRPEDGNDVPAALCESKDEALTQAAVLLADPDVHRQNGWDWEGPVMLVNVVHLVRGKIISRSSHWSHSTLGDAA